MIKITSLPELHNCTVAIIGLGYVGLPLAVELARNSFCKVSGKKISRKVIGFDIQEERLNDLTKSIDRTNEISKEELSKISFFDLTKKIESIARSDVFIITVPTPIDKFKNPDLSALKKASATVGKALKLRAQDQKNLTSKKIPVVIFESTVFPGTTEEICVPIIEKEFGHEKQNNPKKTSFVFGYSPERINPGDKTHSLVDIKKITSGNNKSSAEWIKNFYGSIIKAGVYSAKTIKIAEAAKIIENTQRDLNIALVNELAIIFKFMNIDTLEVIEAASTKWNFIPFKPGLVGGHCIGVDPYYLTYKAELFGYSPRLVLAGRSINDSMGEWIAEQIILEMARKNINLRKANILIMGFTFKENCSDIRNTRVIDLIRYLASYKINLDIVDPLVNKKDVKDVYHIDIKNSIPKNNKYSVVIAAVAHAEFINIKPESWLSLIKSTGFFFDIKGFLPRVLKAIRL